MATVVVPPTAAAKHTPKPSPRKQVKKSDDMEGMRRNRLRKDGHKVSKEDIKKWILDLITEKARTPSDLADITKYTRQNIYNYCIELQKEGRIEKEGQAWKLKGLSSAAVVAQKLEDLSQEEFYKLPVMQKFLAAVRRQPARRANMTMFEAICFGKVVPEWKINPEIWREPETTDAFVQAYCQHYGVKEPPRHVRMALRNFIMYALELTIEKAIAEERGISGKKDNAGAHKHVKLYYDEINRALDMLEGDEQLQALVACFTEGFPRPERGLLIELSSFQFGKKSLEFAYVKGQDTPIIDQGTVHIMRMQNEAHKATIRTLGSMLKGAGINVSESVDAEGDLIRFETVSKDFATFNVFESKTTKLYQKYMVDQRKIEIVRRWVQKRKAQGFRYLFYDGKEDVKESQEGKILQSFSRKTGMYDKLRKVYTALGKTDEYFDMNPGYALRHIGAHVWLRRTNYNYGIVTAMGWESADTLMGFYGGMDEKHLLDTAVNALAGVTSGAFAAIA